MNTIGLGGLHLQFTSARAIYLNKQNTKKAEEKRERTQERNISKQAEHTEGLPFVSFLEMGAFEDLILFFTGILKAVLECKIFKKYILI